MILQFWVSLSLLLSLYAFLIPRVPPFPSNASVLLSFFAIYTNAAPPNAALPKDTKKKTVVADLVTNNQYKAIRTELEPSVECSSSSISELEYGISVAYRYLKPSATSILYFIDKLDSLVIFILTSRGFILAQVPEAFLEKATKNPRAPGRRQRINDAEFQEIVRGLFGTDPPLLGTMVTLALRHIKDQAPDKPVKILNVVVYGNSHRTSFKYPAVTKRILERLTTVLREVDKSFIRKNILEKVHRTRSTKLIPYKTFVVRWQGIVNSGQVEYYIGAYGSNNAIVNEELHWYQEIEGFNRTRLQ